LAAKSGFETEIQATRSHTTTYATDAEFRKRWLGLTKKSRNLRAQQLRIFGSLISSIADNLAGWRILDLGCGDGRWLRTFLEFDANPEYLVGVDVSEERFELGRVKNPLITFLKTDGVTIPVKDESFHLVTQFTCFSNIPTVTLRQRVADEVCRVLKPGGFLFWWDLPYTTSPVDINDKLHPSDYFYWATHISPVGEVPFPSECLRPMRGMGLLAPLLDHLGYPLTHIAALIGPKP